MLKTFWRYPRALGAFAFFFALYALPANATECKTLILQTTKSSAVVTAPMTPSAFDRVRDLNCEEAMKQVLVKMSSDAGREYVDIREVAMISHPTVAVISSQPGSFGGERLVLKKTGAQWASGHVTVGYDLQGDPRWVIQTLGNAAKGLGFEMLDAETMTIPNAEELTGRISAANQILSRNERETIAASFYKTSTNDNVSVAKYMRMWRDHGQIPLGHSGNHYVHDISFHTGALYLPRALVAYSKNYFQAKAGLFASIQQWRDAPPPEVPAPTSPPTRKWFSWLKSSVAPKTAPQKQKPTEELVKAYKYWFDFLDVIDVDNGTGLLNVGILNSMHLTSMGSQHPSFLLDPYFTGGLSRLIGGAHSIEANMLAVDGQLRRFSAFVHDQYKYLRKTESHASALEHIAEDPPLAFGRNDISFPTGMSKEKMKILITDLLDPHGLHTSFGELTRSYLQQLKTTGLDISRPAYQQAGYKTHEEFLHALCALMSQKRLDLIQALELLESTPR